MNNPTQDPSELKELIELYRQLTPRIATLEIGSLQGFTLSEWMKHSSPGGVVISIDMLIPECDPRYSSQKFGHEFMWDRMSDAYGIKFMCVEGDSRDVKNVGFINLVMPRIDFLFIDGGHDYDTCRADWNNYGKLVRSGGMVAFHDISGAEWPGVRKVWDEVKSTRRHQEIIRDPAHFGIGVLYK